MPTTAGGIGKHPFSRLKFRLSPHFDFDGVPPTRGECHQWERVWTMGKERCHGQVKGNGGSLVHSFRLHAGPMLVNGTFACEHSSEISFEMRRPAPGHRFNGAVGGRSWRGKWGHYLEKGEQEETSNGTDDGTCINRPQRGEFGRPSRRMGAGKTLPNR